MMNIDLRIQAETFFKARPLLRQGNFGICSTYTGVFMVEYELWRQKKPGFDVAHFQLSVLGTLLQLANYRLINLVGRVSKKKIREIFEGAAVSSIVSMFNKESMIFFESPLLPGKNKPHGDFLLDILTSLFKQNKKLNPLDCGTSNLNFSLKPVSLDNLIKLQSRAYDMVGWDGDRQKGAYQLIHENLKNGSPVEITYQLSGPEKMHSVVIIGEKEKEAKSFWLVRDSDWESTTMLPGFNCELEKDHHYWVNTEELIEKIADIFLMSQEPRLHPPSKNPRKVSNAIFGVSCKKGDKRICRMPDSHPNIYGRIETSYWRVEVLRVNRRTNQATVVQVGESSSMNTFITSFDSLTNSEPLPHQHTNLRPGDSVLVSWRGGTYWEASIQEVEENGTHCIILYKSGQQLSRVSLGRVYAPYRVEGDHPKWTEEKEYKSFQGKRLREPVLKKPLPLQKKQKLDKSHK